MSRFLGGKTTASAALVLRVAKNPLASQIPASGGGARVHALDRFAQPMDTHTGSAHGTATASWAKRPAARMGTASPVFASSVRSTEQRVACGTLSVAHISPPATSSSWSSVKFCDVLLFHALRLFLVHLL